MRSDKTWVCSECGTVNQAEFDICFRCGAARGSVQEPPAYGKAKKQKPEKKPKGEKARPENQAGVSAGKGKWKPVLIAALIVIALFVGISAAFHSAAKKLADEGKYGEAAAKAKFDLLFSANLKESAFIEKGMELYNKGDYAGAEKYLRSFTDDETAKKYLNLSNMMLAYKYYDRGNYDKAIELIEGIDDPSLDLKQLRNDAYFSKGFEQLKAGNLEKAQPSFENVTDDPLTADYLEIIKGLDSGDYVAAAKLAEECSGNGPKQLPLYDWKDLFEKELESADRDTIDQLFRINAALRMLSGDVDFTEEEPGFVLYSQPKDQSFNDEDHTIVTIEDLNRCGSSEDGKIIVLWEIHKYDTDEVVYYIDWDIMGQIPKELYPESLEEVGRSVRIVCGGEKEGWYNLKSGGSADAVREYSTVYAVLGYNGGSFYSSPKVWGPTCPYSIFSAYDGVPVFGGLTDYSDNDNSIYIYKALRKLVM